MGAPEAWTVELDELSRYKALRQGVALARLVRANIQWLPATAYNRAVAPYGRGAGLAAMSVVRQSARMPSFAHSFLVTVGWRDNHKTVAGMGKIVHSQAIRHPEAGKVVRGTFVDYWLGNGANSDAGIHEKVARAIVAQALGSSRVSDPTLDGGDPMIFTTIEPNREHQPGGFPAIGFEMVGRGPDVLEMTAESGLKDVFGITKQHRGAMELHCMKVALPHSA